MMSYLFTKTPLVYFIQGLWRDEAFSFLLAKKSIIEIIMLSPKDFTPPLYYIILHMWINISGSSEIALRIPSLLFSMATLYVMFLCLRNILKLKRNISYICLLCVVCNPFFHYYAFEARAYTLFMFLAAASFYALYMKKYRLYIAVTILGLYTHYFMIFAICSQLFFILISRKKNENVLFSKYLIKTGLLYIPWLIYLLFSNVPFSKGFWIVKPAFAILFAIPGILYSGHEGDFGFYNTNIIFLSILVSTIIGSGFLLRHSKTIRKEKNDIWIFLFSWAFCAPVFVFFLSYLKPIFLPRYLIFSMPGLLLLIIYSLKHLPIPLIIGFVILLSSQTLNYSQLQIQHRRKADFGKVIREIKLLVKPDDVLYVTNELNFHLAEYYFDTNRVYIYAKSYAEIPPFVGKILIPEDRIKNVLPTYPNKAFILHDDLHYTIEALF